MALPPPLRLYPTGPGLDRTPLGRSALPESNWTRAPWNVWFSKFLHEYKLAVVYPILPAPQALALHERTAVDPAAKPALYAGDSSWRIPNEPLVYAADGTPVDDAKFKQDNVRNIVEHAKQHGGVVSFTMVNNVFLDTARSWLCNVDVAGFKPRGLLWAVTDEETRDAMTAISDSHTVLLDDVKGGKETGHEFGNPGYWKLMLERTALIGEILRNGVAVFAFETDAIWLEDPEPYIQELVRQDADVVGTINTRMEVSGNFFYLRPTLATRRMWDEVTNGFEAAFRKEHFEKKAADSWTYIENDQSLLTKLVLRNETWRRSYPLTFLTLDMELFTDGRWYKPEEGFYTTDRAREPVVINNNFVIGVQEKTMRAKKWDHWFWDEKQKKCLNSVVEKAVRKSRKPPSGNFIL
ncbi:Glycosyltransferase, family GT77 [Chondrus crispus]|uniref:Glycosyltransferase, family GT77 n=1 Tax=Chondrus crispus TaxID=2769 RepID=R7Q904_CHOCR|nr:Glycosyltransferase, family GT77 [Chondrus crispus]CDF34982.1 Glycosyltransferase, family GT77 [Chondrus crispus]|eukprot:XP_005714801.1 Glycosyltransferase, family GT77 [Chondrus crispus]